MADHCDCGDLEWPSAFERRDVEQARKIHECTECGQAILPGESYEHVWGVWPSIQREPMTHRTCARCMVLKEFVAAHIPCACIGYGTLLESCAEEIENCDDPAVLRPEYEALRADIDAQPRFSVLHEECSK